MEEVEVIVGSFRLTGLLESSTSTYFAEHRETRELCVLKFFRGERVTTRLWNEIAAVVQAFPGREGPVCPLYEVGFVHGEIYAAAPYLHGANVAQVIKALSRRRDITLRPSHERVVAWLVAELALGVASRGSESFQHPVFESDLALPQELFVLYEGQVRSLDVRWSWLRALSTGSPWGSLESSLAYKMPAPARGEKRAADAGRAWALGVMLWELLVGYRLFRRNSLDSTLQAVQASEIPDPRSFNPTISKEMARFVQRALSHPGAVSLKEIEDKMRRIAQMRPEVAKSSVQSLMSQLFPDELVGISTKQKTAEKQPLDAFLDQGVVQEDEDSTTCIVPPPSVQADSVVQLSWLEEEAAPRMRVVAHHDKKNVGMRAALLLVACSIGSFFAFDAGFGRKSNDAVPTSAEMSLAPPLPLPQERAVNDAALELDELPVDEELAQIVLPDVGDTADAVTSEQRTAPLTTRSSSVGWSSTSPRGRDGAATEAAQRDPAIVAPTFGEATGDVVINGPPGTKVSSEGRLLGTGSFTARLSAGEHLLKIEPVDGPPAYMKARVRAGAMAIIDLVERGER